MPVSSVQHSDSVIHIYVHSFSHTIFHLCMFLYCFSSPYVLRVGFFFFFQFYWDIFLLFFIFVFLGPPPWHNGSSQAKGRFRTAAAGFYHSHSNAGSELHLHTAHGNSRSLTHWVWPGIKPKSSWVAMGTPRYPLMDYSQSYSDNLFHWC